MSALRTFGWSIGGGFRPFTGYQRVIVMPTWRLDLRRALLTHGWWELSLAWGFREGRLLEGDFLYRHDWSIRFRLPVRLIWRRNSHWSRAWTGRDRELSAIQWRFGRRWRMWNFGT